MGRFLLSLILISLSPSLWANSCCGQSPASFTVLSLDQKIMLSTTYSFVQSQGRVFSNDDFFVWDGKKREIQSLNLNVAGTSSSRSQYFVTTSFLQGFYQDELESGSSQNISDTQAGFTYEVLSEYNFSYWKPIIYLSLIANLPTGKSIYDKVTLSEGADVTGHNQWGLGLGVTLRKVYFPLTLTLQAKSLKIFSRSFESGEGQNDNIQVSDFYDTSVAFLANYATGYEHISLNAGITMNQLSQRRIAPSQTTSGVMQNSTILLGIQRPMSEAWGAGISYSDQTLVGRARNTLLNKTISLNINYNYF